MIGSIRGTVIHVEGLCALIECKTGLGYEVEVPASVLPYLKEKQECFLYTHHVVREDASLLYGFTTRESRLLFRELLKISGIGPKVALALLSNFTLNDFIAVINQNRVNALVSTPGVGKKTAERLIVEMKDRLVRLRLEEQALSSPSVHALEAASAESTTAPVETASATKPVVNSAFACDDAIAALVSLGYKEATAMATIKAVFAEGMDTQELIVSALSQLSKRS